MLQLLFLFFVEQLLCRSDRSADLFLGFEPSSDLPGGGADAVWWSGRCVLEQRGPALRSDPHQPGRLFYMPTRSHRGQAVHLNVKLWEDGEINSPERESGPLHTINTVVTWIQTSVEPVTGVMTSVGSDACSGIAIPCV